MPPLVGLLASGLLAFTPGLLNEYLFNSFGAIGVIPLALVAADRFHEKGSLNSSFLLAGLLVLAYWISNLAFVQFCLIYLAAYSLFRKLSRREVLPSSFLRLLAFYGLSLFLFLGLVAYYIFPFVMESLRSDRSHLYRLTGSYSLWIWVKSLLFPFTSWIFLDEKMMTTGILTYLETLPLYFNVLLLPCLFLGSASRNTFRPQEMFFFWYVIGYMVLSVINQYVPVLGAIVWLTRGTGWHRSDPFFFFSAAACLAVIGGRVYRDRFSFSQGGVARFLFPVYRGHLLLATGLFATIGIGLAGVWVAVSVFDWGGIYSFAALFTARSREHLEFYLHHLFSLERFPYLLSVPVGIALSLWAFEWLRVQGKEKKRIHWLGVLFAVAALASQYSLSKLYYPFNRGALLLENLPETRFLRNLSLLDRVGMVAYRIGEVEKHVISENYPGRNLPSDLTSGPQFQLLMQRYPEFSRFQSNNTMLGTFFVTLGVPIYNRGAPFTWTRFTEFNLAILPKDDYYRKKFQRAKEYVWISAAGACSRLLDVAGLAYIMSSLPLSCENFEPVFKGNMYQIYGNKQAVPRFLLVDRVRKAESPEAALSMIRAPGFDPLREVVVEEELPVRSMEGTGEPSIQVVLFHPNTVQLRVNTPSEKILVFSDSYHPGWRATIDSKEVKIHHANYVFKAVQVPAGTHKVEFRFSPPGFLAGMAISLFCTVFLVGAWVLAVLRKEDPR
ncbi:MAG: YfhO family protein [Candidatus Tectomicrobia bacterium]|uniref:YfhO family protein n=1 Tax=Tectimicrobiota bacterium TaxID=2528274 RepID=A0A932MNC8_UNCTE|nr:YfhO family protein [Candidatus Tectomicrobia bacterium]